MFSKFFHLVFLTLFLMTPNLHASSSSSSVLQDDDGVEIPKIATTTPLPNRDELLKQFQRLSGYPESGYYALSYEGAAKVPGGIWGIFPWNWSYDLRVLQPLEALLELYTNDQLIALMGRKDFHGCLKLAAEYGALQDFWAKYVAFNKDLKKNQRSNKLSWKHFLVTPAVLKAAQDVHELNLGGADLKVLPALPNLYLLQSLNLAGNGLSGLPGSMSQMTNLEHLDLSSNQFVEVPEAVQHLTNLKSLYLEKNLITEVWLARLRKLETLDLSDNRLEKLDGISDQSVLARLYVSGNQLDTLFCADSLVELDLSKNNFKILPESLSGAKNLMDLDVSDNKLEKLSAVLGSLKKLKTLGAQKNNLTELPGEIAGLEALQYLNVSTNKLTALPEGVSRLAELKTLKVSGNKLADLPGESLSCLNKLRILDLSDNQLVALDIRGLPKSLRVLNVHDNSMTGVSTHLLGLPALRTLTLDSKAWNGQSKPDSLVLFIGQKNRADGKIERDIKIQEPSPSEDDDSEDEESESES